MRIPGDGMLSSVGCVLFDSRSTALRGMLLGALLYLCFWIAGAALET